MKKIGDKKLEIKNLLSVNACVMVVVDVCDGGGGGCVVVVNAYV